MRGPYLLNLADASITKSCFQAIGCDPTGLELMFSKAHIYPFLLRKVKCPGANILKQHMLSLGGEAVVARWAVNMGQEFTDVLLLGTLKQYRILVEKLEHQPWGLKQMAIQIKGLAGQIEHPGVFTWELGDRNLIIGERPLVMGILNITPDSFSDGGLFLKKEKALEHARRMVEDGADILDVGGESTRPGSRSVSTEEELERVMPVLEILLQEIPLPISLDTYKSKVAKEAVSLGVHIINDVGGGKRDREMAVIAAQTHTPVIIMHNPGQTAFDGSRPENLHPYDLVTEVIDELEEGLNIYIEAGLNPHKVIIDPGIGFGKSFSENLIVLQQIMAFKSLGKPVLLGASRKSFIGAVLGAESQDRMEGSLAAALWGIKNGVDIVRVHDVKETVRVLRFWEAIRKAGGKSG